MRNIFRSLFCDRLEVDASEFGFLPVEFSEVLTVRRVLESEKFRLLDTKNVRTFLLVFSIVTFEIVLTHAYSNFRNFQKTVR